MLKPVKLSKRSLSEYRELIDGALFDELQKLGKALAGKRILHINATEDGGGVAELLHSIVPLQRDLGLEAEWQVIKIDKPGFFEITKKIHNGMQGSRTALSAAEWDYYEVCNRELSNLLDPSQWDVIQVHDPQPAAIAGFAKPSPSTSWIWRCHIDSSHANRQFTEPFSKFLTPYKGAIFTLPEYVFKGYRPDHLANIPMAIDPLSPKNQPMELAEAKRIVAGFGIDPEKPLICQVSRFDPWKDPLGVIEAWRLAKAKIPDLQLALVGSIASDDPEGDVTIDRIYRAAKEDQGLFMIVDKADDRAVHAFYTVSVAVLQKSLREGFGLTVSEAMWAGTPVIGGDVGGIPTQIETGKSGYLVTTVEEAARMIVRLAQNPDRAKTMGEYGHELVRSKFLLPRLVRDELSFIREVLNA